ncbi:MAG: hypothetical protein ACYC21_06790 [Eubacteriales bacterium]
MKQKEFQEFVINHLKNQSKDIKSLKDDVSSLSIRVTEQEKFQEFATKHLMILSERVPLIESAVLRIETRIENEIVDKIQVLFDGHLQHDRRLDRLENKLGINI